MGDRVERLGLTIDPAVAAVVDSGGNTRSGAGAGALSLKVSPEVLGSSYGIGPEIGTAFSYGGKGSVLGWSAGLRSDFDMTSRSDVLRLSAGYIGERFMTGNTTEHGVFASIAWYMGGGTGGYSYIDNDGRDRFRRSPTRGAALGIGPYVEYFPSTKRTVAGLNLSIGFDVL